MQTLHLRFRDLRAILLGETPGRWPTPSLRTAATWKGALPLPSLPRPTLAVGAHPETSHQRLDRCPKVGPGLTMASPLREPRVGGATARDTRLVCWLQTAENNPHPAAHQEAGQAVDCSLQARHSEVPSSQSRPSGGRSLRCSLTPSFGLSFPRSSAPQNVGASGEKTADLTVNVVALAEVSKGALRQRLHLRKRVR